MSRVLLQYLNRYQLGLYGIIVVNKIYRYCHPQHVEEFSNAATKRDSFITTTRKLCDRRKKTAILVRTNPSDVVQVNFTS